MSNSFDVPIDALAQITGGKARPRNNKITSSGDQPQTGSVWTAGQYCKNGQDFALDGNIEGEFRNPIMQFKAKGQVQLVNCVKDK